MTEFESQQIERVRFDVSSEGTLEGDDGSGGQLAASLRYVCRMASQAGALLDLGELQRLNTLSTIAVFARIAGAAPELSITAEVEYVAVPPSPPEVSRGSRLEVRQAIDRALRAVTFELTCDWAALISDDSRLVGAMHDDSLPGGPPTVLGEVGLRALAVIGALDASMRESALRFDFPRGSLLVVPLREHALFVCADKFESSEVMRSVRSLRALLVDVDLGATREVTASVRA